MLLFKELLTITFAQLFIFSCYCFAAYDSGDQGCSIESEFGYGANDSQDERCSICLDPISTDELTLKCRHSFHSNCIDTWHNKNSYLSCPMCRDVTFGSQNYSIEGSTNDGAEALIDACDNCDINLLSQFINAKANVNGHDNIFRTPLYAACLIENEFIRDEAIENLLRAGANNFYFKNKNQFTALMSLSFNGRLDSIEKIIQFCVENKLSIDEKNLNEMRTCCPRAMLNRLRLIIQSYQQNLR